MTKSTTPRTNAIRDTLHDQDIETTVSALKSYLSGGLG